MSPNHPRFIIESERQTITGWRYLWCKHVTGFSQSTHCARCLKGTYMQSFGKGAPTNEEVTLQVEKGAILYFCGVSTPYRWEKNMHLAVEVTGDLSDTASVEFYTGDMLTIRGAASIMFTDEAARGDFPERGKEFLTCRNFQFGAHMRKAGAF